MDLSSATARVSPDLSKALAILSDATVRRSEVDWEDLKLYWKLEKKQHFSMWWTSLLCTSFSKNLLPIERRLTGMGFFDVHLSPNILKYGDHRWALQIESNIPSDTYNEFKFAVL